LSPRMRKRLPLNLLLFLFSLGASILILEVVLRVVSPEASDLGAVAGSEPARFFPDSDSADSLTGYDPDIGWRNVPGVSGTYRGPDEAVWRVKINSRGYRDREHDPVKEAGVRRVAFLGDSFAWGYGLRDEERLSNLTAAAFPGIEVFNLGLVGTSTDQQCLILERAAPAVAPDGVVLLVHDTDIWHNALSANYGKPKPHFVFEDGRLELRGIPVPTSPSPVGETIAGGENGAKEAGVGIKGFLGRHSRLYRLVAERLKRVGPVRDILEAVGAVEPAPDSEYNVTLTAAIIGRMRESAELVGAESFVVILIPSKELIESCSGHYLIRDMELIRREEESAALAVRLRDVGFDVIELGPEFIDHARKGETLYFDGDNHWNARANQLAVERLIPVLQELGYGGTGRKR